MILRTERIVTASLPRTWRALLDVRCLVAAMPGATLAAQSVDGTGRGSLVLGTGESAAEYRGTIVLEEIDEDERAAAFRVRGRATRGAAVATVRGRCSESGGATRVVVEAELNVTGAAAVQRDAAGAWLDEFVAGLEHQVLRDADEPGQVVSAGHRLVARRSRALRVAALVAGGVGIATVAVLLCRRAMRARTGGEPR